MRTPVTAALILATVLALLLIANSVLTHALAGLSLT